MQTTSTGEVHARLIAWGVLFVSSRRNAQSRVEVQRKASSAISREEPRPKDEVVMDVGVVIASGTPGREDIDALGSQESPLPVPREHIAGLKKKPPHSAEALEFEAQRLVLPVPNSSRYGRFP